MKKFFLLLSVIAMCFSLFSCGVKTEDVEITMDNWEEYFELADGVKWTEDDFGDTKEARIYSCFCVREEYADRIVLDKSSLTVEVSKYYTLASVDVDLTNKTISDITYFEPLDGVIIGERTSYDTFTLEKAYIADELILQGSNGKIVNSIMNGSVPSELYDGVNDQQGYALEEFSISRIQGTIAVKEAN